MAAYPKISVISPVYNVAPYIRKCIESLLSQTYSNFELILVDDGSTDESGTICDEYAAKDYRIRVIHQANQGVSAARNRGIELAKGIYIAFVDADDKVEPNYLAVLQARCAQTNADICCCDYLEESGGKKLTHRLSLQPYYASAQEVQQNVLPQVITSGKLLSCWAKFYKRDLLTEHNIRFRPRRRGEDWLFNIESFAQAKNVAYVPEALYHYVHNVYSAMMQHLPEQFDLWIENRTICAEVAQRYHLNIPQADESDWVQRVFYFCAAVMRNEPKHRAKVFRMMRHPRFVEATKHSSNIGWIPVRPWMYLVRHRHTRWAYSYLCLFRVLQYFKHGQ
jgi:glycosyltransferase involved in cell wall biosynthesis